MAGPEGPGQDQFSQQAEEARRREAEALQREEEEARLLAEAGGTASGKGKESKYQRREMHEDFTTFRPLDVLGHQTYEDLHGWEKEYVKEALEEMVLTPFLTLSEELRSIVEATAAKKHLYGAQNSLDRSIYTIAQTEAQIKSAKEGDNKIILRSVLAEQIRHKSTLTIFGWSVPYLSTYWGGMESGRLVSERGMQLPMSDLDRFYHGTKAKLLRDKLKTLDPTSEVFDAIPLVKAEKKQKQVVEQRVNADGVLENVATMQEETEVKTSGDRLAKYTADSAFWNQIRGEMNIYNPVLGGKHKEILQVSTTMQDFVAGLSSRQARIGEVGEVIDKVLVKKIKIYLDQNGDQVLETAYDELGNKITTEAGLDAVMKRPNGKIEYRMDNTSSGIKPIEFYVDTLDYFNKSKSDYDRKWIIATTAAMCIENAKDILDSLPRDVSTSDRDPVASKKYKDLVEAVNAKAIEIMENYDDFDESLLEQKIATTAFDLSYAISFGSFSIADIGWSNEWSRVPVFDEKTKEIVGFHWVNDPGQGDPTASGDAFSLRRPWVHDAIYAIIKGRASDFNVGAMPPVSTAEGKPFIDALLSEVEEINQRDVMVEKLKAGEHPHIARYFGVIGAYENELKNTDGWQKGAEIRAKTKRESNPNLIKSIEESVMYIPTPFKGESQETLIYPIILPQFQVSLFDMLTVSKDYSVGDMFRLTWRQENGKWVETTPDDPNGVRLTQMDIDWSSYGGYADDGRAVNDNFITQAYASLYGPMDPKNVEAMESSPMKAITTIIKFVDIGARNYIKRLKGGGKIERQSFETMYAASIIFQNLALGVHHVIGRGGVDSYKKFIAQIPSGGGRDNPNNLYTVLRTAEDLIKNKQGYDNYASGIYLALLAMSEAIKPIVVASDDSARKNTKRMASTGEDITGMKEWEKIFQKYENVEQ